MRDFCKFSHANKPSRHLYPILLHPHLWCQKEELFAALLEAGIGAQVHYKPTYEFSFYKKMLGTICLKGADEFYKAELSIPCHQEMSQTQARFVRDTLFGLLERASCHA